jgi:hypothetical protein
MQVRLSMVSFMAASCAGVYGCPILAASDLRKRRALLAVARWGRGEGMRESM